MNTRQLEDLLRNNPITRSKFCGVYAENTLPRHLESYPCGVIVNTDPKGQPGQHWVAFYLTSPQEGEFFDSYGHTPQFYSRHYVEFLNRNVQDWTSNPKGLQSTFTAVCGEYCIFYLLHRARGVNMNTIVNVFHSNKEYNDHLVYRFVIQLMRQ